MRLDTDSILPSKIYYDLFDYMEKSGIKYAYRIRWDEGDCWGKNMIRFIYEYVKKNNLLHQLSSELSFLKNVTAENFMGDLISMNPEVHLPDTFYTNFDIMYAPRYVSH